MILFFIQRTFDREGRGQLGREECAMAMRAIGYDLRSSDVRSCDVNGFIELVCQISQHLTDKEPLLQQALRPFDSSGQGWVDMEFLKWGMTSLGEPMTNDEWRAFEYDCQAQQGQANIDHLAKRLTFKR